jgi:hypothetical protein
MRGLPRRLPIKFHHSLCRAVTQEMTPQFIEIDPEAILIPQCLGMEIDVSVWHICDAGRMVTWCGLLLSRGSERRPLSETPEERRCVTCVSRFGEGVIRHPAS